MLEIESLRPFPLFRDRCQPRREHPFPLVAVVVHGGVAGMDFVAGLQTFVQSNPQIHLPSHRRKENVHLLRTCFPYAVFDRILVVLKHHQWFRKPLELP